MKRKRFIRLLMAEGWSRNEAAVIAGAVAHRFALLYAGMRNQAAYSDPAYRDLVRAAVRYQIPYKGL